MIGETLDDVKNGQKMATIVVLKWRHRQFCSFTTLQCALLPCFMSETIIEEHNNMSDEYTAEADTRKQNQLTQIKIGLSELLA